MQTIEESNKNCILQNLSNFLCNLSNEDFFNFLYSNSPSFRADFENLQDS